MKSVKYTIDRFEGDLAVLLQRDYETKQKLLPLELLGEVNEGDIITIAFDKEKIANVTINVEETNKARQQARNLLKKLSQNHE